VTLENGQTVRMLDIAGQGFFPVAGCVAEQATSQRLVTGARQGQSDDTGVILSFVEDDRPLIAIRLAGFDLQECFACAGIIPCACKHDTGRPL